MSVTINTFPPLHTFTYSRSWFLAFIVLLHVGFFWALTNGLSIPGTTLAHRPTVVVDLPVKPKPHPTPLKPIDPTIVPKEIFVPKPEISIIDTEERSTAARQTTDEPRPQPEPRARDNKEPQPVVVEPAIGRAGLSEPLYPTQAIRMGITGTVVLSIQVLPNGRVGDVRLVQSSGFPQLDESAMREARRWRIVPGTRDGVATAMWKQIPITFRLRN